MLESQFYSRLVLIAIFGVLFIFSMLKKGKKNSIETPPEKHIALKVISIIFCISGLISLIAGIISITNIQFPSVMGEQPLGPNSIVRSPYTKLIWGYPTTSQILTLNIISGAFAALAFAAYFAVFRKSSTKWWHKTIKVIGIILMWMFYISSSDLHYFDGYELFPTIAFLALAVAGLYQKKKTVTTPVATKGPAHEQVEAAKIDDTSRFMPSDNSAPAAQNSVETTDVEL